MEVYECMAFMVKKKELTLEKGKQLQDKYL